VMLSFLLEVRCVMIVFLCIDGQMQVMAHFENAYTGGSVMSPQGDIQAQRNGFRFRRNWDCVKTNTSGFVIPTRVGIQFMFAGFGSPLSRGWHLSGLFTQFQFLRNFRRSDLYFESEPLLNGGDSWFLNPTYISLVYKSN
jgi:hypothetical protein